MACPSVSASVVARRPAIPVATERAVLARQAYKCNTCGAALCDLYDIDHVIPRCFRPRDDVTALQALCVGCHARKTRVDEAPLIAAHKRADTRVCWAGCKRVLAACDYDDAVMACPACAPPLREKQAVAAAAARAAEEERALVAANAASIADILDGYRYVPHVPHVATLNATSITSRYFT